MLEIHNVTKSFTTGFLRKKQHIAVDNISFTIPCGKTFGLMGPSGSGKSTIARLITGLLTPTSGKILYQGSDIASLSHTQTRQFRRKLQLIGQQPGLAFDPRQTIGAALLEPLLVHKLIKSRLQGLTKLEELLAMTKLSPEILQRYPWQLSGGQAQRAIIARALGLEPDVIIADEPTAMLDVSVQAHILNLLKDLQAKKQLSLLLISHDPGIIKIVADIGAIMRNGSITTIGPPAAILRTPDNLFALRRLTLAQTTGGSHDAQS